MLNISHYKIIAIGKIKKQWIQAGIKMYLNRLPDLQVIEIKDSTQKKEENMIKEIIKKNEILITLNENGKCFTSSQFARKLQDYDHQNISFAIGGATGISPELNNSASLHLSLSPLTLSLIHI